jgi:hypothetical protein
VKCVFVGLALNLESLEMAGEFGDGKLEMANAISGLVKTERRQRSD